MSQLAFDFDDLTREPYAGRAPLHFTVEYFTAGEFEAAWEEYIRRNGHFDCIALSHMWHAAITMGNANTDTLGHDLWVLSAETRCAHYWRDRCSCVGSHLYQAVDNACQWHVIGSESEVVEAWHDHAWPGWRELPIVDDASKLPTDYPEEWRVPGAPVITARDSMARRHVNGRSPWRGFDMSSTAVLDVRLDEVERGLGQLLQNRAAS